MSAALITKEIKSPTLIYQEVAASAAAVQLLLKNS
jgi:hypothetical protein